MRLRPPTSTAQNSDFPKMSNDMTQSGMCTVVGMWTRAILREESCGDGCTRSICHDDYVAEFAWIGGPTNDASAGMGYSTSKVDMAEVDMTTIDVRINTQCVGGRASRRFRDRAAPCRCWAPPPTRASWGANGGLAGERGMGLEEWSWA